MNLLRRDRLIFATWLLIGYCVVTAFADPSGGIITALIVSAITTAASVGIGILAQYLAPKPKPIEVNKADPRFQASEYGQVIPRVYGKFGNVAGQIVDAFPIPFKEIRSVTPGQGGKRKTPDTINYTYYVTVTLLVCDGPIQGITQIKLDTDVFYTGAATGSEVITTATGCASLRIYLGTDDQSPDSVITAQYGSGNVTAYRDKAYVVIEDLELTKYYNRIPNITFDIVQGDGNVAQIIIDEMTLAGLLESEIDVTELEDETIAGIYIGQRSNVKDASLNQIADALGIDFSEADGQVKAYLRPRNVEVTIPVEDLGAYDYDSEKDNPPARTQSARKQDGDIPRGYDVVYFDTGRAYEKSTQGFDREIFASLERGTATYTIAMSANEANRIAKVKAVTAWNERTPFQFSLPPQYLIYTPATVANITTLSGKTFKVRFEKVDFGLPGQIKVQAVTQLSEAYSQIGEGEVGLGGSGDFSGGFGSTPIDVDGVLVACNVVFVFSNLANLDPTRAGQLGFYAWATRDATDTRSNAIWQGAGIVRDYDGDGSFITVGNVTTRGIIGKAHTTLADGTDVDETNTVDINLEQTDTLSSISNDAFTASRTLNLAILGNEVIQFRDATRPDAGTYPKRWRLSHLRRALLDTAAGTSTHTSSDDFAIIDASMVFVSVVSGEVGTEYPYYPYTPGTDPYDYNPIDHQYDGYPV